MVGSLMTVAKAISKYRLELVGVQEVRWDKGGTKPVGEYTIFYGKGNENHELHAGFFAHKRIILAAMGVESVSDRMSYITLRGRWCDIIVPNVHTSTEDKIYDVKVKFYAELERVFDIFPKDHMKILLGDFNVKVGREDIFKPTAGNERLQEIRNDNRITVAKSATSKSLTIQSTMFPLPNIHKFT
jgi:exonuclease III